jgi:catechol 2,3-dioxygenase-like lactoylglutathione lyase family enzyme
MNHAVRNLISINPFFIVKNLQDSISFYIERLGFELDFQGRRETCTTHE